MERLQMTTRKLVIWLLIVLAASLISSQSYADNPYDTSGRNVVFINATQSTIFTIETESESSSCTGDSENGVFNGKPLVPGQQVSGWVQFHGSSSCVGLTKGWYFNIKLRYGIDPDPSERSYLDVAWYGNPSGSHGDWLVNNTNPLILKSYVIGISNESDATNTTTITISDVPRPGQMPCNPGMVC